VFVLNVLAAGFYLQLTLPLIILALAVIVLLGARQGVYSNALDRHWIDDKLRS